MALFLLLFGYGCGCGCEIALNLNLKYNMVQIAGSILFHLSVNTIDIRRHVTEWSLIGMEVYGFINKLSKSRATSRWVCGYWLSSFSSDRRLFRARMSKGRWWNGPMVFRARSDHRSAQLRLWWTPNSTRPSACTVSEKRTRSRRLPAASIACWSFWFSRFDLRSRCRFGNSISCQLKRKIKVLIINKINW